MTPAALKALAQGDIANALAAMTPARIEAQEKAGQIEQSFQDTLPINGTQGEARKQFEALGFIFGNPTDNLFTQAQFPKGWRKKVTDHDMWTDILDETGKQRGSIFYKAAFYDRTAFVRLERE